MNSDGMPNLFVIKEEIKAEAPSITVSSDCCDSTSMKTEFSSDYIELQNVDIKYEINEFDSSFLPLKQTDSNLNLTKKYVIKEELLYCYSQDDLSDKTCNSVESKKDCQTFECYQCNYKTTLKYKLVSHMQCHRKNKELIYLGDNRRPHGFYSDHCPDCDYQTSDKSNMRRHLMKHGRLIKRCFYCYHCDYHTTRKDSLIIHISRNHQKVKKVQDKLECVKCGFVANSKTNLEIHKSKHKNMKHMKVHECTECSYKTIYKTGLMRHIASHGSLENMFSCYLCNYKAARKDELKNHIGRHNKSKCI